MMPNSQNVCYTVYHRTVYRKQSYYAADNGQQASIIPLSVQFFLNGENTRHIKTHHCVTLSKGAAQKPSPLPINLLYRQCMQPILRCLPTVLSAVIKSQSAFSPNQSLGAFKGRTSITYNYCSPSPASDPGCI